MKSTRTIFAIFTAVVFAGCGGSPAGHPGGGGAGGGGGGAGGGAGTGGNAGPLLPAGATLGTYIVLGDSVSDRGGTGPFFYDLLHTDLAAKYPGLTYVHAAQQGAISDLFSDGQPTNAPLLKDQIAGLAGNYPGDVLVTITIGGNDLNGHAVSAIAGSDAGFRSEYGAHITSELQALTAVGRLGTGKVYVVLTNIYDFTDGKGNFRDVNCGPPVNVQPTTVTATFGAWNMVNQLAAEKVGGALYDMHADFMGHGYNNPNSGDVWYDRSSCIHPDAKGHDAIRRGIYRVVTGETLP